jgi:hypothetical protein
MATRVGEKRGKDPKGSKLFDYLGPPSAGIKAPWETYSMTWVIKGNKRTWQGRDSSAYHAINSGTWDKDETKRE